MPAVASTSPGVLLAHLAAATDRIRRRLRRGHAAQPPDARGRRAVRDARGPPPGPHRPRHRPGPWRRPHDRGCPAAHGRGPRCRGLPGRGDRRPRPARAAAARPRRPRCGRSGCRRRRSRRRRRRSGCSGSSSFSAELAGSLGLPFSYAHHFNTGHTLQAAAAYRRAFRPSPVLDVPASWSRPSVLVAALRRRGALPRRARAASWPCRCAPAARSPRSSSPDDAARPLAALDPPPPPTSSRGCPGTQVATTADRAVAELPPSWSAPAPPS